MTYTPEQIAQVCHEANRVIQSLNGEVVNARWDMCSADLQESAVKGVQAALDGATPIELHDSWVQTKLDQGWTYGLEKSELEKTHPQMVAYEELPAEQRIKDHLFGAIVQALSGQPITPSPEQVHAFREAWAKVDGEAVTLPEGGTWRASRTFAGLGAALNVGRE